MVPVVDLAMGVVSRSMHALLSDGDVVLLAEDDGTFTYSTLVEFSIS
jgi:ferredoxin-NADP reductase